MTAYQANRGASPARFRASSRLALALMPLMVLPALAHSQESPVEAVRSRNVAVQRMLPPTGDSIDEATKDELKDVINGLMDFEELSRLALGRYWGDRPPEEQAEFVDVFRQLVRRSSVAKLSIHRADSLVYLPPEVTDGGADVTTIAHKDKRSLEIVYRMHRKNGEWKAFDVIVDGSSTMRTYRDSFYREISATSFPAMLRRLKEKLAEDQSTGF